MLAVGGHASAYCAPHTQQEIDQLTREIANDPNNGKLLQERGLFYATMGQKDKAIADYKAALKFSSRKGEVIWSYGWALFDLDQYPQAVEVWKTAALMEKDHPISGRTGWIAYTLALGYWAADDRENAFAYFTLAAKTHSDLRFRDSFMAFTDHWNQKEQALGLQLFDAWNAEINKPGSHLW